MSTELWCGSEGVRDSEDTPLIGLSISTAINRYEDRLNASSDNPAHDIASGETRQHSHVFVEGDRIELRKPQGRKG